MGNEILPYQIIAGFMETYENLIKPQLKEGKLKDIKFLLVESCLRAQDIINQEMPGLKEPQAYASYRMAIVYLNGLIQNEDDEDLIQWGIQGLEKHVSILDSILEKNPHYAECRETTQ